MEKSRALAIDFEAHALPTRVSSEIAIPNLNACAIAPLYSDQNLREGDHLLVGGRSEKRARGIFEVAQPKSSSRSILTSWGFPKIRCCFFGGSLS